MQAPRVSSGTLARALAPRFGAGTVATPRAVRASAAGARFGARRFQAVDRRRPRCALSTRRLTPLGGAAAPDASFRLDVSSRAGALARRASHVAHAASRNLSEFPVADRRAELNAMKMAQLKPLCKGSGLRQGGKKQELISRLLEHEFGTTDDEADIDPKDDIVGLANEWRSGRSLASGVSFGEMDLVEGALRSSGIADERAADAAFYEQGFDDGGYARSSEARGDQNVGAPSAAARVMGRDGRGFDDGGGAGWGDDDDSRAWYAEEETERAAPPAAPTAEERAEAKRRAKLKAGRSLERRSAIVTALRTLATEREGFESDPRVHLEAVSRAIERAYRDMRYSAFAKMDDRSRDVCVDINVATGTLAILAQRVGRAGTVEWEVDDTEAFLEAHSKRHQIRKLAYALTEEINEAVSVAAADSYVTRNGEMVEATVVAAGRDGELLLKLDDGAFACLPKEERVPDVQHAQGDRICALVIGVEKRTWAADKRAPIIVSCGIAGLLAEVIKAEVPEVANGSVLIKGVARVSGVMSKVAVAAAPGHENVNPVLACVGAEHVRMRAIRERLGGENCQILPFREDPEAFVAEALFPAVVQRVQMQNDAGSLDERGNPRRMDKFVAYCTRFDEAKAIGAGGVNVKLAAALCGCFIMVERHEEMDVGAHTGGGRWSDAREDDWLGGDDASAYDGAYDPSARSRETAGAPIDLTDDGLDEIGWPDLEPVDARQDQPNLEPGLGGGGRTSLEVPCRGEEGRVIGKKGEMIRYIQDSTGATLDLRRRKGTVFVSGTPESVAMARGLILEVIEDGDTRQWGGLQPGKYALDASPGRGDAADPDPRDDDANWEEVGPGKVGVVTFGGNLGAGITGGCSFMGDPEELEAERLGDAAEAAIDEADSDPSFFASDDADALADDADLFADDDLFGEDWNQ